MGDGRRSETTPSIAPHLVVSGRYQTLSLLAEGAMGRVFEAWDIQTERSVALKLLRASADPEMEARFRREATVASRLNHPHVVTVFDYGRMGSGGAYLVMEHVQGRSLQAVLDAHGRLEPGVALGVAVSLGRALQAVHAAGVVHRDVKPSNVMIETDTGMVKLLDFGVARVVEGQDNEDLTPTGLSVGSVGFMAPEQALGLRSGPEVDVYALGVLTFTMIAGERPFRGVQPEDILRDQIRRSEPEWPLEVPAGVDAVVRRAMAVDPDVRTPDMENFVQEALRVRAGLAR